MHNDIPQLETVSAKDLLTQPIEPIRFTIDAILPEGLFILGGNGKIGKSWLALDMSNCVASGGALWYFQTAQGDVLYLALEDHNRRLQGRLIKVVPECDIDSDSDIHFVTKANRLGCGLAEQLTDFLDANPQTRLIVIDTLKYIRNNGKSTGNYSGDYNDMDALREIIAGRGVTMLLITHTNKARSADPLNSISGSTGLTGAADGVFVLEKMKRSEDEALLTIINRDTESREFILRFDKRDCRWQFVMEIRDDAEDADDDAELYEALLLLLDKEPTWKGTTAQLHDALVSVAPEFSMSAIALAKTLRYRQEYLRSEHGVVCAFTRNKSARLIELSRETVAQDCEASETERLRLVG
jgi:hypothetical protein